MLGARLLVSPFVPGFRTQRQAVAMHLSVGLLAVLDALWNMCPRFTRTAA